MHATLTANVVVPPRVQQGARARTSPSLPDTRDSHASNPLPQEAHRSEGRTGGGGNDVSAGAARRCRSV